MKGLALCGPFDNNAVICLVREWYKWFIWEVSPIIDKTISLRRAAVLGLVLNYLPAIYENINTYSLLLLSPELTLSSTPLSMSVSGNIGSVHKLSNVNMFEHTFVRIIVFIFMKSPRNNRFDIPQMRGSF